MSKIRSLLSNLYHKMKIVNEGVSYFYSDMKYFMKHSNLGNINNTESKMRSSLIASYHIIEKGLSMPNRRLGFGHDRILSLIQICKKYYSLYGLNNQLLYAVSIIKEYDELHKNEKFTLDDILQNQIDSLLSIFPSVSPAMQFVFSKEDFFAKKNEPFDIFSTSRHSMRHFNGSVSIESLIKAIDLAKQAPSACNKQPVRVYIVTNKDLVRTILNLQQGNRGFGQHIDNLLVLTTQFAECTRFSEQYMPFIDAGIFTMNLLYSLHFNSVGAIPLVWLSTKERDKELRSLLSIPENQKPAIIIGVGSISNTIICAQSPRLETKELIVIK